MNFVFYFERLWVRVNMMSHGVTWYHRSVTVTQSYIMIEKQLKVLERITSL